MPYFSQDDIAQIATPAGAAPLGALRLSGENAFAILARATAGLDPQPGIRQKIVRECRMLIPLSRFPTKRTDTFACPARVFLMPGPGSYTREDVAEIHLPGSPVILRAALAGLVKAGARAALPGEFTFRAFRNGRLTLSQAEAVEDLVKAGSADERRRALARLGDRDVGRVREWRDKAMDLAARLEAALDFSEEELEGNVAPGLAELAEELRRDGVLATSSAATAAESDLPHIALVGLANAGKSSLFNALVEDDAVLVSPAPSTTRDSVRRDVEWRGARLTLSDNPGFHPEGGGGRAAADRATARLGGEDLACWVIDASRPLGQREEEFAAMLPGKTVVALNKCDLPREVTAKAVSELARSVGLEATAVLEVSAATGHGVDRLGEALAEACRGLAGGGLWNRRELLELERALDSCRAAAAELAGAGRLELAADDLRIAVAAFSRTLGEGYAEEALTRIFSQFCIGK